MLLAGTVLLASSLFAGAAPYEAASKSKSPIFHEPVKGMPQDIQARFQAGNVMKHVQYLSQEIGPRVAGTEEEKEAADYIRKELKRYGYSVETESFSIPDRLEGELEIGDKEYQIRIAANSAITDDELEAEVVRAGLGRKNDFPSNVKGKIALIQRGEITYWDKVANAVEKGAAAVIFYDNADALAPSNPSLGDNMSSIPVVSITKADGEKLVQQIAKGKVEAELEIEKKKKQKSQNVVAVKKASHGPKESGIVYVSAHYDSVPYSPGANDNGSGTGLVLELARILSKSQTDKELRFVFVGAEEIGLRGSKHYVSRLSKEELKRSVANYNVDMPGTAWDKATKLYVNVVDGKPNLVWLTAKAAADRLGNQSLVLYKRGSSDHVSFHEAGIPAANFIRREPGTASLEPWYHSSQDTIDHVSKERLQEAGELLGITIYDLVRHQTGKDPGGKFIK